MLSLIFSINSFESVTDHSYSENWELIKEKNDIKVYIKRQKNDFASIRIQMKIYTDLHTYVDYVNQVDKYPDWIYSCSSTNEIYRNKDVSIYSTITDMPYPFYDRILTLKSKQTVLPKYFEAHSYSIPSENPNKRYVVIPHFECHWYVKEIESSLVVIDYEAKTDPGGSIPVWLYNMGVDLGPYRSMLSLKQILESTSEDI